MSGFVLSSKDAPALEVAEISESSSVQRSINTLRIMFRSNVELMAGSEITISGLTGTAGASTYRSTSQALGDAYFYENPLHVTGMSSHFFRQDMVWDAEQGTLVLTTTTAIQAKSNMIISTEVQNGAQAQSSAPSPKISISSPGSPATAVGATPTALIRAMPPTNIAGTVLQSTCTPAFEIHAIGQSSPYPLEQNMLTITLASNFDYRARTGDKIVCTLSGLAGAVQPPGSITLLGADPFASGCMKCECPSSLTCGDDEYTAGVGDDQHLTFHIAGDMDAGCKYSFGTYMSHVTLKNESYHTHE